MTYDAVAGISDEANSILTDYEAMCKGLEELVSSLADQWEGSAKKEFLKAYKKIKPKQAAVRENLQQYSISAKKACELERSTDRKIAKTHNHI